MLRELASKEYDIPGSRRRQVAEKTLQYLVLSLSPEGLAGLAPKQRCDHGQSKISTAVQERLLAAKRENPRRSLPHVAAVVGGRRRGAAGRFVAFGDPPLPATPRIIPSRRCRQPTRGTAQLPGGVCNQIWFGDVMHGPRVLVQGRPRKTYLVSLLDDASRLIAHSAFCLAETALEIEGVLKQGVLKRGVCNKLIVDNGSAYRSQFLARHLRTIIHKPDLLQALRA